MTKADTIKKFNLFIDDTSELSSQEESDLYDKIYYQVTSDRPWERTKSTHSATTDGTVNVSLPSDFGFLVSNANHTDSSFESERPVVFVGTDNKEYEVVSWSDRRQYRDQDNKCWIDIANSNLVFAVAPSSGQAVEFDYHSIPAAPASGAEPWIPDRFCHIIYHGMCADSFIIQQSEKAKSYRQENLQRYKDYMEDLAYWNANLIQM